MRVSIITPTLNANAFVAEAIESVVAQNNPDVEHIVVDGGSNDGTLDTLGQHLHLRVLLRPGTGLYAALNVGLAEASGEIIGFLNADDSYTRGAIAEAAAKLGAAPSFECAAGGSRVVRLEGAAPALVAEYDDAAHKMLSWDVLLYGAPVMNARFFRRSLFNRIGCFDTRYKIAADREWLIRAKLAGMCSIVLDGVIYEYRQHAGSLTLNRARSHAARIRDEHLQIIHDYLRREDAAAVMRRWHAWETGRKVINHLAHGKFALALSTAHQEGTLNALWPAAFLAQMPARIIARVASQSD
jgi:glycosyltransferase involved in cell wall biosynthesis